MIFFCARLGILGVHRLDEVEYLAIAGVADCVDADLEAGGHHGAHAFLTATKRPVVLLQSSSAVSGALFGTVG